MEKLLQEYANYNRWANERICNQLKALSEAQMDEQHISSFPTLRKTIAHVAGAENIWLQRVNNLPNTQWHNYDTLPIHELSLNWLQNSEALVAYTENASAELLLEKISFTNLKGMPFAQKRYQMLFQAFSHSSFHRGQVITFLRQVGVNEIIATDYLIFTAQMPD